MLCVFVPMNAILDTYTHTQVWSGHVCVSTSPKLSHKLSNKKSTGTFKLIFFRKSWAILHLYFCALITNIVAPVGSAFYPFERYVKTCKCTFFCIIYPALTLLCILIEVKLLSSKYILKSELTLTQSHSIVFMSNQTLNVYYHQVILFIN